MKAGIGIDFLGFCGIIILSRVLDKSDFTEEHICGNAPNADENFKEQIRDIIVGRLP